MSVLYFHEGQPGSEELTITGELWSDIKLDMGISNWILRIPAELIQINDKLITLLDVNKRVLFNDYIFLNDLIGELWDIISSILDSWNRDLNIVQERVMLFLEQLWFNEVVKFDNKSVKEVINNNKNRVNNNILEVEKRHWS
jgi:hypothetical protein